MIVDIIIARAIAFSVGAMITGCVFSANDNAAARNGDVQLISPVAIYPTAHRTDGDRNGDSADVTVDVPFVELRTLAVRFATADAPADVVAFYRRKLAAFGRVSEHAGGPNTQIKGFTWRPAADQTTLTTVQGSLVNIVAVKPAGSGAQFAIIEVDTKKR